MKKDKKQITQARYGTDIHLPDITKQIMGNSRLKRAMLQDGGKIKNRRNKKNKNNQEQIPVPFTQKGYEQAKAEPIAFEAGVDPNVLDDPRFAAYATPDKKSNLDKAYSYMKAYYDSDVFKERLADMLPDRESDYYKYSSRKREMRPDVVHKKMVKNLDRAYRKKDIYSVNKEPYDASKEEELDQAQGEIDLKKSLNKYNQEQQEKPWHSQRVPRFAYPHPARRDYEFDTARGKGQFVTRTPDADAAAAALLSMASVQGNNARIPERKLLFDDGLGMYSNYERKSRNAKKSREREPAERFSVEAKRYDLIDRLDSHQHRAKGEIDGIRYLMHKNKIKNTFDKSPYTKEHLDSLIKSGSKSQIIQEMRRKHEDEDIINLLNKIASSGNQDTDSPAVAKYGGKIKKADGGDIASVLQGVAPVIGAIPGLQIPGAAMGALGAFAGMFNREKPQQLAMGTMRQGGKIGAGFKQYSAPSHEQGGQMIDAIGNPAGKGAVAEIEKNENSYDNYVYSDHLINPDTGRTFAQDAAKINKRTKGKDQISTDSFKSQMAALKEKNDAVRVQKEQAEDIPMARMGMGFPEDPSPAMTQGVMGFARNSAGIGRQALASIAAGNKPGITDPNIQMAGNVFDTANAVSGIGNAAISGLQGTASQLGQSVPRTDMSLSTGIQDQPQGQEQRNLNPIALGLKGAALGMSAIDALRPAEKERLRRADFNAGDQAFQGLNQSLSPMLGEINMGAQKAVQDVSNQAGSLAARNTRVASIFSRAGKDSAFAQMQQQDMNNRLRMAQGQREDMKAMSDQQEFIRQQDTQSRNDANRRLSARKFFTDLSQVGTSLNQIQYARDAMKNQNENVRQYIQYGLSILANKYPDFKPGDDLYDKLTSGKYTPEDLVKFSGMMNK
jgi:hypothetical protein